MSVTMGVKLDDGIRDREADAAWADYQQNGGCVSHDAMTAWLNTWGTDREGAAPELEAFLEPRITAAQGPTITKPVTDIFAETLRENMKQSDP